MKILMAENAGFCFGVKRAIRIASEVARHGKVYTFGPLIHNPQVVSRLKAKGVEPIEDIDQVKTGKLLIRAHGVSLELRRKLVAQELEIVDATCPIVKKSQDYVAHLDKQNFQVVIIGNRNHPEVQGLLGYARNAVVVNSPSEAGALTHFQRMGVVAQTTLNFQKFQEIVWVLRRKADHLKIFNTLCNSTAKMQNSTLKLAKKVDIMLVIGGYNSANTKHLAEICRQAGVTTHHIEQAKELCPEWFSGKHLVGITAGASTPGWIIKTVLNKLMKARECSNEKGTNNQQCRAGGTPARKKRE